MSKRARTVLEELRDRLIKAENELRLRLVKKLAPQTNEREVEEMIADFYKGDKTALATVGIAYCPEDEKRGTSGLWKKFLQAYVLLNDYEKKLMEEARQAAV